MRPKFSVVIPAYNQGKFLFQAVQSVLDQTIQDFEILVVNDASTDDTMAVMAQFNDSRITCITHTQNRRLPAARNTGILASKGEFIALLDADDFFHPHKFESHLRFLNSHPGVGITYNSRYELHHSSLKIRDIYRPPVTSSLNDFVLGYPFSPSDMVIRREVFDKDGLFDESYIYFGEDLEFYTRLALAGNRFERVDGVLNYRRYHSGRKNNHLKELLQFNLKTLDKVFSDPRCPVSIMHLKQAAYQNFYFEVARYAFAQEDYSLGNQFLDAIFKFDPMFSGENIRKIINGIFDQVVRDDTIDHASMLPKVFAAFQKEFQVSPGEIGAYIASGYLIKGTNSGLWNHEDEANNYFRSAVSRKASPDEVYCQKVASQLLEYEEEIGTEAGHVCGHRLFSHLAKFGWSEAARHIRAIISVRKAFHSYLTSDFSSTLRLVWTSLLLDPAFLRNRGVISITARAVAHLIDQKRR